MKTVKIIEAQALAAITSGEFDATVTGAAVRVAVIMTQDWCPQWRAMRQWLNPLPEEKDLRVFELVYNLEDFFDQFMRFKETKWRNGQIPYIRYYRDGVFVRATNYVSQERFLAGFDD